MLTTQAVLEALRKLVEGKNDPKFAPLLAVLKHGCPCGPHSRWLHPLPEGAVAGPQQVACEKMGWTLMWGRRGTYWWAAVLDPDCDRLGYVRDPNLDIATTEAVAQAVQSFREPGKMQVEA